jgi:hypothetical protein
VNGVRAEGILKRSGRVRASRGVGALEIYLGGEWKRTGQWSDGERWRNMPIELCQINHQGKIRMVDVHGLAGNSLSILLRPLPNLSAGLKARIPLHWRIAVLSPSLEEFRAMGEALIRNCQHEGLKPRSEVLVGFMKPEDNEVQLRLSLRCDRCGTEFEFIPGEQSVAEAGRVILLGVRPVPREEI